MRLALGWGAPVEQVSDFASYFSQAQDLAKGEPASLLFLGPRAFLLGAGFWLSGGSSYHHLLLLNTLLFYPLGAWAMWLLSRQILKEGWLLAYPQVVYALWPPYVDSTRLTAVENVLPLAVCLSLWAVVRFLEKRTRENGMLGGIIFGGGLLVKPVLLSLLPLFAFAVFVRRSTVFPYFSWDAGRTKANLFVCAAFMAATVAMVSPWQIYSYAKLGFFEPISPFARHMVFVSNQPYGKPLYEVGSAYATSLMPEYAIRSKARDFSHDLEYNHYAKLYTYDFLNHWPLFFLLDIGNVLHVITSPANEMASWVYPYTASRKDGMTDTLAVHYFIAGCLLLGLGGALCLNQRRGRTGKSVLRYVLLVGFFSTVGLLLTTVRHRMAYEPLLFILGAAWLEDVRANFPTGLLAPLAGLLLAMRGWMMGLIRSIRLCSRAWLSCIGAVLVSGVVLSVWPQGIALGPKDMLAGSVQTVASSFLATPHPALGFPWPDGKGWRAEFVVRAPTEGPYRIRSLYASSGYYPLDVDLNGQVALRRVFQESFGGAYNAFARLRDIGVVWLKAGENHLTLRESAESPEPPTPPMMTVPLAVKSPLVAASAHNAWTWFEVRQEQPLLLESGPIELGQLAAATVLIQAPFETQGAVKVSLEVNAGSQRESTTSLPLLPTGELAAMRQGACFSVEGRKGYAFIRLKAEGEGRVLLRQSVALEAGDPLQTYANPGFTFTGPYVEKIVLERI